MTMHFIASGIANGSNAIVFDNIPQTFTHLQLRITGRSTYTTGNVANIYVTVNGNSTTTNYAAHSLWGDGASASSIGFTSSSGIGYYVAYYAMPTANAPTNVWGSCIMDILDYSSTTKNKSAKMLYGNDRNGSGVIGQASSMFMQTGAVTTLTIGADVTLISGSRADLYGITSSPTTGV
jgi:hypothetical protein